MTITEDYVSFEIAKLLKEKGFDAKCDKCYAYFADDDIRILNLKYPKSAQLLIENRYPCITLQMAIKGLRIMHNLCIVSLPVVTDDDGDAGCLWNYTISRKLEVLHKSECLYESPEIALNEAIKYCLKNLI